MFVCPFQVSIFPLSMNTINQFGGPGSEETILATEEVDSDTAQTKVDR